ncbi:hypothetical protein FLP10_05550 [Agromyces intestinalis]|uniref:Uncharacterized protein n=1 Tax=Agromyces intestinalis TaxID=2592652 RepID=A0A5C1YG31_9MICO|nr:hypothetical protein [Agromyces intestinalis]QEO13947.1 hypothetical protein FLP10_05550 [Agromyces intestinalis]
MSDYMRFLPLSWKERVDESGVHSDRRIEYAEVLEQAALIADRLPEPGVAIGDVDRLRARGAPDTAGAELPDRLRALAADARNGRKVPVRFLARAVLLYLDLAREVGEPARLAPLTSGAVSLYLATAAPTEIRAVIREHALRATDAGWEFGRGSVLEATAVELVEFLGGRSLTPPRRAAN